MLHRYESKLRKNYRVPQEVKFLILLPVLDVKGYKSPSVESWMGKINNNTIIPRKFLHVAFVSEFFGIVPLELSSSFPMGQYESIDTLEVNNKLYRNVEQKLETFFKLYGQHYNKCGVLIPEKFMNQFNEETDFTKKDIIISLFKKIRAILSLNISVFDNLSGILKFFKGE